MANQADILKILRDWTAENGTAPSYAEIGKLAGIYPSTVHGHVRRLRKGGLVESVPGSKRSVRLSTVADAERRAQRAEIARLEDRIDKMNAELAKTPEAVQDGIRKAVAVFASDMLCADVCAVVRSALNGEAWELTERNQKALKLGIVDIDADNLRLTEFGAALGEAMGFLEPSGISMESEAVRLSRENQRLRSTFRALYERMERPREKAENAALKAENAELRLKNNRLVTEMQRKLDAFLKDR